MLERARWLGVFAPNKEVGFPCPAASWRCLDCYVKAAKSHNNIPFSITWAEPHSLTLKHCYNKWLKPWCELSNIEQSKSCSCQRIHSNVRTFAIPTQFFLWFVGHCFDTLTDMHRLCCYDFYLFIFLLIPFPSISISKATPWWQKMQQLRGRLRKVCPGELGTQSLYCQPHHHMLPNAHTYRTSTLTFLTLLMVNITNTFP